MMTNFAIKSVIGIMLAVLLSVLVVTTGNQKEPPDGVVTAPKKDLHLAKRKILSEYISRTYKVDFEAASEIVYHADMQARLHKHKGITLPLILSIIAVESEFDKNAKSPTGAKGLMQLTRSSGRSTSTDIFMNINSGVAHLSDYMDTTKSINAALQAYNIGVGAYIRGGRAELYLKKVLKAKKKFEKVTHNARLWQSEGGRACPLGWDDCSQTVYVDLKTGEYDYGDPGGPGHAECRGKGCLLVMKPPSVAPLDRRVRREL